MQGRCEKPASGNPVAGITIRLLPSGTSATTDAQGGFRIATAEGRYQLQVSGTCWNTTVSDTLIAVQAETTDVDLSLTRPLLTLHVTSLNLVAENQRVTVSNIPIRNDGDGVLTVAALAEQSYANDTWLSVEPKYAEVDPGQDFNFVVRIAPDTTNSHIWDYFGRIRLQTNSCPDSISYVEVYALVLDVSPPASSIPLTTALLPAYPNPFNSITTLAFDLAAAAQAEIRLYDLNGRQVRNFALPLISAESHRFSLDAAGLSSGEYFLSFSAGKQLSRRS